VPELLDQRVVVVTGAAAGLGRGSALSLAARTLAREVGTYNIRVNSYVTASDLVVDGGFKAVKCFS
jgi:NAD(P)-dependent dehydrogenase (short-subunit alcohol dehydrogenase family)